MSDYASIELESYRYSVGAAPMSCFVCGTENMADADLCGHCFAPMALTRQTAGAKVPPLELVVLGSAGVGKTVYLGMLIDILSQRETGLQMLPRGAFSVALQQTTIGALARCEYPCKTPNEPDRWNWVHGQVRAPRWRRPRDVVIPDLAGEAILEELDHPQAYPAIRSVLSRCAGILLLVDTAALEASSPDQDYFVMKILGHLSELDDDPKTGWRHRPVGLVFSKADECDECFADPVDYAHRKIRRVWQLCQRRFKRHRFFACGVAGASGQRAGGLEGPVNVPLRIEPRGVVEPFEWLISQLK